MQFLQSHQNLKHSDLLEDSLEDSDRTFKAAAVPVVPGQTPGVLFICCIQHMVCEAFNMLCILHQVNHVSLACSAFFTNMLTAAETTLDLTKNGNGFLSNVAEAQGEVSGVTVTAAPAADSKPLGFYFAKDIPGLVKEKSLGTRSNGDSGKAVDGKAAMRLYFNRDNSSSGRQDVHTAADVQSKQVSTEEQQQRNERPDVLTDTRSESQHRKVLRGISKGIQAQQAPFAERNVSAGGSLQDSDRSAHADKPFNKTSNPLSVALNFSSVQTDDM